MYSLPGSISSADALLISSINKGSLLGNAGLAYNELFSLHKANKRTEDIKVVEPYADLLEDELVSKLQEKKDTILAAFKKCTSSDLEVPLFSWKSIRWNESLSNREWRRAQMTAEELAADSILKYDQENKIELNDWETKFGVKHYSWQYDEYEEDTVEHSHFVHYPMKVDRIFRTSDLAHRISLHFGVNFYTYVKQDFLGGLGDEDMTTGFNVVKRTLVLKYLPYGPSHGQMQRLLQVARTQKERKDNGERATLMRNETVFGADLVCAFDSA